MRSKQNYKFGFTLAEIMVVLLVLTIIFAAFAPIITKRKAKPNKVEVWQWSSRDSFRGPMDAYYNQTGGNRGTVFFGLTPTHQNDIDDTYAPYSKLVIRSGRVTSSNSAQKQLQFRFKRSSLTDPGEFSGTAFLDTKNILLGGQYGNLNDEDVDSLSYPRRNLGIGYESLTSLEDSNNIDNVAEGNTALGYMALANTKHGRNNVAIGANAGKTNVNGKNNVYLGSLAGYSATGHDNVYVGYASNGGTGSYNTYLGAYTGNLLGRNDDVSRKGYNDESDENIINSDAAWGTSYPASYNTAIGYRALNNITSGNFNTAIGVNALENLSDGRYNTAIGYGACSNVTRGSYKTCIGYNSGPVASDSDRSDVINSLGIVADDGIKYTNLGSIDSNPGVQRTYIGSPPKTFGGDAVLEVHNSSYSNANLLNNPDIKNNSTTIINGNLIVKGRAYLTVGNYLYPFYAKQLGTSEYAFGTDVRKPCSYNQWSYYYNNNPYCSDLSAVFNQLNTGNLSDRRLKNIGTKNHDGLNKILQLKVYNYTFKDDKDNKPHVGVIAQDLQKVFPNAVSSDKKGFLKIRWEDMFYAVINALKELDARITSAIKDAVSLEHKIDKLEKENKELELEINLISKKIEMLKTKQ